MPDQWTTFPANGPYEDRWERCRTGYSRGHTFDFIIDPLVVALLGLT
jgi:hypothetical protein